MHSGFGAGGADILFTAVNAATGSVANSVVFGGGSNDYGQGLVQTIDGGFIIVGETYSYSDSEIGLYPPDCIIVKIDSSFTLEFAKVTI